MVATKLLLHFTHWGNYDDQRLGQNFRDMERWGTHLIGDDDFCASTGDPGCLLALPYVMGPYSDSKLEANIREIERWSAYWATGSCCSGTVDMKCLFKAPYDRHYKLGDEFDNRRLAETFVELERWADTFLRECCTCGCLFPCPDLIQQEDEESPIGHTFYQGCRTTNYFWFMDNDGTDWNIRQHNLDGTLVDDDHGGGTIPVGNVAGLSKAGICSYGDTVYWVYSDQAVTTTAYVWEFTEGGSWSLRGTWTNPSNFTIYPWASLDYVFIPNTASRDLHRMDSGGSLQTSGHSSSYTPHYGRSWLDGTVIDHYGEMRWQVGYPTDWSSGTYTVVSGAGANTYGGTYFDYTNELFYVYDWNTDYPVYNWWVVDVDAGTFEYGTGWDDDACPVPHGGNLYNQGLAEGHKNYWSMRVDPQYYDYDYQLESCDDPPAAPTPP